MKNIFKIFISDLSACKQNVVSVILTVGLIIMPSMFVWYNVLACWDVFGNTGNLKVAVANTDVGYKSELLPMDVNVGNQVTSALRENDQMNWVFTTEEDAIDGAASGRYYAALVIPETFSQEMLTFYSNDAERAPIIYYSNEKKSAIAPKVTDQGADQISYTVNKVFAQTISEVSLNLVNTAIGLVDDDQTTSNINSIIDKIDKTAIQTKQHTTALSSYLDIINASQELIKSSQKLSADTKDAIDEVKDTVQGADESISSLTSSLEEVTNSLTRSIKSSVVNYENGASVIDQAFETAKSSSGEASEALKEHANRILDQAESYEGIKKTLEDLKDQLPEESQGSLDQFIGVIETSINLEKINAEALKQVAEQIENGSVNLDDAQAEVKKLTDEAVLSLREVEKSYSDELEAHLEEMTSNVAEVTEKLSDNYNKLSAVGNDLSSSMTNADSRLEVAKSSINEAIEKLNESGDKLSEIADRLRNALDSGDLQKVKEILGDDPSLLAESLSAPIGIERIAEFPVANFGSAMSPLYATLGLWVGCLLSVVLIKVNPSEKTLQKCERKPHLHEIFLGRFGVFAVISLLQSSVMAFGNLVFLGVQATDPILYLLCFWVSGLVFQFIMYTLVASFGNVGKAIGVLLLIIQVTGSGGSFPLQLLPEYATILNPFLPATYVINAMRASMMGLYNSDYWIYLAQLLTFLLPMILLGLILRRPFVKLNETFVERVEKSKLI